MNSNPVDRSLQLDARFDLPSAIQFCDRRAKCALTTLGCELAFVVGMIGNEWNRARDRIWVLDPWEVAGQRSFSKDGLLTATCAKYVKGRRVAFQDRAKQAGHSPPLGNASTDKVKEPTIPPANYLVCNCFLGH